MTRYSWIISLLILLLFVLIVLDVATGSVPIPFSGILKSVFGNNVLPVQQEIILHDFRMPRVITALLAGAALSTSGLQMQTLFRNPLAGPYVLGISSGASLGVAIALLGSGAIFTGILSAWGMAGAAWLGAGLVLLLLLLVTIRIRNIMTILILGIMFSSALSAIISILQYFGNAEALKSFVIWSLGSLGEVSGDSLRVLVITVIPGLLLAVFTIKGLNVLSLGDDFAHSVGVHIMRTKIWVLISTSILAGSVTAFCGPIGFIGIAVPHITRILINRSALKYLLPANILTGMCIMLAADILTRFPGTDQVLPLNAITSLIGIPVVIWVVVRRQKIMVA